MNKKFIYIFVVDLVFASLFSLISFVIPFPKQNSTVFYLNYFFGLLSILSQVLFVYLFINKREFRSIVFGWPIFVTGIIYLAVQLISVLIFYIINAFIYVPLWVILVVDLIIISFVFVAAIIGKCYKDEVEHIEEKSKANTSFIENTRTVFLILLEKYTDEPLHSELITVNDLLKYSDPVSSKELSQVEGQLSIKIDELKFLLNENSEIQLIDEKINEIKSLIGKRNIMCKNGKK